MSKKIKIQTDKQTFNIFESMWNRILNILIALGILKKDKNGQVVPESNLKGEDLEIQNEFLSLQERLKKGDLKAILSDMPDFLKKMENIAQNRRIAVPSLIFKDDKGKEYISLGFNGLSEDDINKYLSGQEQELSNRIVENRFYLKDKKVRQMEFNVDLSYRFGVVGELSRDFIANYKASMMDGGNVSLNSNDLKDINNQLSALNDKNLQKHMFKFDNPRTEGTRKFFQSAIHVKHTNKDENRRGYTEVIKLQGKTKNEIERVINSVSEGAEVFATIVYFDKDKQRAEDPLVIRKSKLNTQEERSRFLEMIGKAQEISTTRKRN